MTSRMSFRHNPVSSGTNQPIRKSALKRITGHTNLSEISKWPIVICGLLIYPSVLTLTRVKETSSPGQHLKKCIGNNMENRHTDFRV